MVSDALTSANVNTLFRGWHVSDEPDLVSIDIDGNDYYVWRALEYRPRVIVIEYNGSLPVDAMQVQPESTERWDGSQFYGASAGALIELGRAKGYAFVHAELTGTNLFFVRDDLASPFELGIARPMNQSFLGTGHRSGRRGEGRWVSAVEPERRVRGGRPAGLVDHEGRDA